MVFKKSDNALLFWLIAYDFFFSKYNRTGVFKQSEIGNEHAAILQNKCILNFRKYKSRKKL